MLNSGLRLKGIAAANPNGTASQRCSESCDYQVQGENNPPALNSSRIYTTILGLTPNPRSRLSESGERMTDLVLRQSWFNSLREEQCNPPSLEDEMPSEIAQLHTPVDHGLYIALGTAVLKTTLIKTREFNRDECGRMSILHRVGSEGFPGFQLNCGTDCGDE